MEDDRPHQLVGLDEGLQFSDDASVGETEDEEGASPSDRDAPAQPPGEPEGNEKRHWCMSSAGSLGNDSAAVVADVVEEKGEGNQNHCLKKEDRNRPKVVRVERPDLQGKTEGREQGEGAFLKIAEGSDDVGDTKKGQTCGMDAGRGGKQLRKQQREGGEEESHAPDHQGEGERAAERGSFKIDD
ncbi:MAG: hypothetical protein BWY50_01857 [Spirochaetes bacterium ADurb.Bin315]|nr:MAG: hypothetical protein BWY50_01857 [Spirochaetes bacterium ADurb.Bin315]